METTTEETVGQSLRRARETRGYNVASIASAIRVPAHYLRDIEDGRYESLPGAPYAIGFIRSYAQYLGLSAEEMIGRYKSEANPCTTVHTSYWHEPVMESRLPQRSVVFMGLIAAVGVYSLWFSFAGENGAMPGRPVVPDHLLAMTAQAAEDATAEAAAAGAMVETAAAEAEAQPMTRVDVAAADMAETPAARPEAKPQAQPAAQAVSAETVADAADLMTAEQADGQAEEMPIDLKPKAVNDAPSQAVVTVAATGRDHAAAPKMATVHVIEDAWLHVTAGDKVLFSGVLQAGRRYQPPAMEGVVMTTGNAGGVVIEVGDWRSAPLGDVGRVRRNIPLDAISWHSKLASADGF